MDLCKPLFSLRVTPNSLSLSTQVYKLDLAQDSRIAHAASEFEECLVIGDAFLQGTQTTAEQLLLQIALRGPRNVAENLDGSFFIVWLNHSQPAAIAISDITGSRKVFVGQDDNSLVLSDRLSGLNLSKADIDPTGLVEFLLNGVTVQNRTVFSGVSFFPRASLAEIVLPQPKYCSYWNYDFDDSYLGRSEHDLVKQFADTLEEATRIRAVNASNPIAVSLSGGYDSTCILGSLLRCRPKDSIVAFSYATNPDEANTDAAVAHETCQRVGVEHCILPIPTLTFGNILDLNARYGGAAANLCGEIGVWDALTELFPPCRGRIDCFLATMLLATTPIGESVMLRKCSPTYQSQRPPPLKPLSQSLSLHSAMGFV